MCELLLIIEGVLILLLGALVWRLEVQVKDLVEITKKIEGGKP